jgi:hypothetical protein
MGMMGTIEVLPAGVLTTTRLAGPQGAIDVATVVQVNATVAAEKNDISELTGTVQFTVDGIRAGSPVAIVEGRAAFSTSFEVSGVHSVGATYSGDSRHDESVSPPLQIRVSGSF